MNRRALLCILLAFCCFALPASARSLCRNTQEVADRWQWVANYVESNKKDGFDSSEIDTLTEYLAALGDWTSALVDLVEVEGNSEARGLARKLVKTMNAAVEAFNNERVEPFVDRIDDAVRIIDDLADLCN
jgi:hypothetical protein